jgi:hypothetical protein
MKTFRNLAIAATVAGAAALPAFAHAATVTLPSVSANGGLAANILGLISAALGFSVSA